MKRLGLLIISGILATSTWLVLLHDPQSTGAANAADFRAGRIMDDEIFTRKDSMSAGDIQNFLNSKVPACDTLGTKPSEYGSGTRAQYGTSQGIPPPYTCLKDYTQNGLTAAQIIWNKSQEFSINPQVLLVLLQKEQGLVTDDWPWPYQYRSATGYGCPDGAPCDAEYYGFINQVHHAARMYRKIMDNDPNWYTPYVVGNNTIKWHPNSGCGTSQVNIENRATAALYSYTPYRPNQAALDNLYGTGDGCSSYGNRNFWRDFTDWFGSTNYDDVVKDDDGDGSANRYDTCQFESGLQIHMGCPENNHMASNSLVGDFNGDGFGDVLAFSVFPDNRSYNLWLYKGSNNGLQDPELQRTLGPSHGGWEYTHSKAVAANINGDQYVDVVIFHRGPNNEVVRHVLKGSASGIQASDENWVRWQLPSEGWSWSNLRIAGGADVNGDGMGDVLVFSLFPDGAAYNIWRYPGSVTGLQNPVFQKTLSPSGGGWHFKNTKSVVSNVNGDSFADLVIFHRGPNNDVVRHTFKGSATGLQDADWVTWQFPWQGWAWNNMRIAGAGDYNGDGMGDVLMFSVFPDNVNYNLWLYKGSATGLQNPDFQRTLGPGHGGWDYRRTRPIATDASGDGKMDLIIFHQGPRDEVVRHILRGSSTTIQSSEESWVGWQFPHQGWRWSYIRLVGANH